MMFCRNCGAELENGVCPACGYKEENVQSAAPEQPAAPQSVPEQPAAPVQPAAPQSAPAPGYVPPAAQPYAYAQGSVPPVQDKKSVGLNILGFFFPVVGLILYLVTKKEKPVRAKSIGKSALAGFIIGLVVTIASYALFFWIGYRALQDGTLDYDLTINGEQVIEDGEPVSGGLFDDAQTAAGDATNDTAFSWAGATLLVDGVEISLPCSYAEFTERTGYAVEPDEASLLEELLGENNYTFPTDAVDANGREMQLKFYNPDADPKPVKDCMVVGVQTETSFGDPYADIVFPGNVRIGSAYDLDALRAVYGQADNVYKDDSSAYTSATWRDENDAYNTFRVYAIDGATINEIELNIYPASTDQGQLQG